MIRLNIDNYIDKFTDISAYFILKNNIKMDIFVYSSTLKRKKNLPKVHPDDIRKLVINIDNIKKEKCSHPDWCYGEMVCAATKKFLYEYFYD